MSKASKTEKRVGIRYKLDLIGSICSVISLVYIVVSHVIRGNLVPTTSTTIAGVVAIILWLVH